MRSLLIAATLALFATTTHAQELPGLPGIPSLSIVPIPSIRPVPPMIDDSMRPILEYSRQNRAATEYRRRQIGRQIMQNQLAHEEQMHRAIMQRNAQERHERSARLRWCAQYNLGCFNELGGR